MKVFKIIFLSIALSFIFMGCGVGTLVALPFKVTGEVINVVAPDIVGDSISAVGDAVDTVIPF